MRHLSRLLPIAVAASLLLTGCVFAVDHEMEDDEEQNAEDLDPEVTIDGPEDVVYVDGDDFSLDHAITCEPEDCEEDLRCATTQGGVQPEFDSCDTTFSVTEDHIEEGEYTLHAQLFDGDEVLATDSHTTVALFEFDIAVDDLDPDESTGFSHPELGEFSVTCTHPDCELIECGWDDDIDSDYEPDSCDTGDPLVLQLPSGTAEATLTIAACAEPEYPVEDLDHCVDTTYEFDYRPPVWEHVATAQSHTCAILDDQSLWCWGNGTRLGLGDDDDRDYPVEAVDGQWRDISSLWRHSCAINVDDELYCWGDNGDGQVDSDVADEDVLAPVLVDDDYQWDTVAPGHSHTCAITAGDDGGDLFCWGDDDHDQLGEGTDDGNRRIVDLPSGADGWLDVSSGWHHTCAIAGMDDDSRNLYCWGRREHGRLGDGGAEDETVPTPQLVTAVFENHESVAVVAGWRNTCAIADGGDKDRQVYCWGNSSSLLGIGDTSDNATEPVAVVFESGGDESLEEVESLSIISQHVCAVSDDLYCWGDNDFGRLGNEAAEDPQPHPLPVDWSDVGTSVAVTAVATGNSYTCAIAEPGDLYCWGIHSGALGQPSPDDSSIPTPTPIHWPFAPE